MISPAWQTWTHPKTSQPYTLSVHTPSTLSSRDFNACFSLIELTSGDDYRASKDGWKPKAKKKEMKLLDLRYLTIKTPAAEGEEEGEVKGFVSIMPTHEDDYETLYIYEIHLHPDLQGAGLGASIMGLVQGMAEKIEVEKIMLSVWTRNEKAVAFYRRMGFDKDEFSPEPRVLRNGSVKECEYLIMSKAVGL